MVLLMIPIFEKCVFPKVKAFKSPLNRMVAGGIAAGTAFLASGILELQLEKTYPILPSKGEAALNCINTLPCTVHVETKQYSFTLERAGMVNFR